MSDKMTLDKAIEIQEIETGSRHIPSDPDLHQAMCLGIEALKWRILMETDYGSWCGPKLPGED